jgi:uncharacterized protein YegP (UPF0339 family)
MRILTFNGHPDTSVLKTLYFGYLQGGNNLSREKKDRAVVRLEARIHEKFEAVIEDDPADPALPWRLKAGTQRLALTSEEYQHVDKCLDAVPWPTSAAKAAAAMLDAWADAERTE